MNILDTTKQCLNAKIMFYRKSCITLLFAFILSITSAKAQNIPVALAVTLDPEKAEYLMGETVNPADLLVEIIYDDNSRLSITNFNIHGDTFTRGDIEFSVDTADAPGLAATFIVKVSGTLINTGLPVIYIETHIPGDITSKDTWRSMDIRIVSDNPEFNLELLDQQMRGRGNSTWNYPKKPYRIRFRTNTSVFGRTAARNWVLLANYKDSTLLTGTIAFELGQRIGLEFTNTHQHVDVVFNGNYHGSYLFTEHRSVAPHSVDIDPTLGFLVELDDYYDEDPKFRTAYTDLPVMIKSPDFGEDADDPRYDFIRQSLNQFDSILATPNFTIDDYYEHLYFDSFVDYLMVNEIVRNIELSHPKSVFMYREHGEKLKMGPLWDFDWAYGLGAGRTVTGSGTGRYLGGKFAPFFNDPVFHARYRDRWNENYEQILAIPDFVQMMADQLTISQEINNLRWEHGDDYPLEINKMKTWLNNRINFLNTQVNLYADQFLPPANLRAIVQNIVETSSDEVKIRFVWETPYYSSTPVIGYHIYRGDVRLNTQPISELEYVIPYTAAETQIYKVTAVYAHIESEPREVMVSVGFPPTGLTATSGLNSVQIAWIAPEIVETILLAGYRVERRVGNEAWKMVSDEILPSATLWTDHTTIAWVTYEYRILALYTNPEYESVVSNVDFATPYALNPPQELKAIPRDGMVILMWNLPEPSPLDVKEFKIYRNGMPLITTVILPFLDDIMIINGFEYAYYIKAVYALGESEASNTEYVIPKPQKTKLIGNYPNPFNPSTVISFDMATEGHVRIDIYNIRGQRIQTVANEHFGIGEQTVEWNGTDESGRGVASGIYFYQMNTENFMQTRRMVLMK